MAIKGKLMGETKWKTDVGMYAYLLNFIENMDDPNCGLAMVRKADL